VVKLREAMDLYSRRTGQRVTYDDLAEATGLSAATIQFIGSRPGYNATLVAIDKLCTALRCQVSDLLEHQSDEAAGS